MKTEVVKAFTGQGKDKTFVGEKIINVPENVKEAVDTFGETNLIALAVRSHVIDVQREIRAGTEMSDRKKVNALVDAAKAKRAEGDDELYDTLVRLGVIAK